MLIEFSVENFRSIRERVTLSMVASDEEGLEGNLIKADGEQGEDLLKSAVIYGANASGKSNVLKAFEFMVDFVRESHARQMSASINVNPFRLDAMSAHRPSEFHIIFCHEGTKYAYGIIVDQAKVHEEYLYRYGKSGEQGLIFERSETHHFEFGIDEQEQGVLSKRTLDNGLYLSVATQFNYHPVAMAFEWFQTKIEKWMSYGKREAFPRISTMEIFVEKEAARELIKKFFRSVDVGIRDIKITKGEIWDRTLTEEEAYARYYKEQEHAEESKSFIKWLLDKYPLAGFRTEIFHGSLAADGTESPLVAFDLHDESQGTIRLFELIGPWIEVLLNGDLLVVDELEQSLHPLITEQLIKLFNHPIHNTKGAQLIFTTHNTNLLDSSLFRRDQIWFTEKDSSNGSTDLYALVEFKPRESESIEQGYLIGRYGAIPFFGKEFLF